MRHGKRREIIALYTEGTEGTTLWSMLAILVSFVSLRFGFTLKFF
jgi:hypothetical protein